MKLSSRRIAAVPGFWSGRDVLATNKKRDRLNHWQWVAKLILARLR